MLKWGSRLKKVLKDQRGLTLIELLAVIVILGIIAAIAIPSILNLTSDTRKEAIVVSYKSMGDAARLLIIQKGWDTIDNNVDWDKATTTTDTIILTLKTLLDEGYIEHAPQKYNDPSTTYGGVEMQVELKKETNGKITYSAMKIGGNGWVLLDSLTIDNLIN
jgi:type IV pilus assembly protein PilA